MEAYAQAVDKPFSASRKKFEEIVTYMQTGTALGMRHEDLEQYVTRQGLELQRRLLQDHLDVRALAERRVAVMGEDGVARTEVRAGRRQLMSVVGEVSVTRLLYQSVGVGSRSPADAALNLPCEVFSLGVRRRVAEEVAANSFDHAVERIDRTTGAHAGKRQVEELAQRASIDFEAFYGQRELNELAQEDGMLLVLSFDGAGITMLREDLREGTRRAAEKQASDPRWPPKRMKRGQRRNRKRMAQVAAVYAIERFIRTPEDIVRELRPVEDTERKKQRPKPIHKRVWASIERSSRDVIEEAFREAKRRDPAQTRRWIVLVDGQETQRKLVWDVATRMGVNVTMILDLIHVLEYLWKASYCFHAVASREAQEWVDKRLAMLLSGTSASDVAAGMTRSATLHSLTNRAAVDECARYLRNNRELLRYADALAGGLPIATGVIEGACRYLVRDRMDKTGARWSLCGAEAVLKLRALCANGDFDEYWRFHVNAEYSRNHAQFYQHAHVPDPLPKRPTLRVVK